MRPLCALPREYRQPMLELDRRIAVSGRPLHGATVKQVAQMDLADFHAAHNERDRIWADLRNAGRVPRFDYMACPFCQNDQVDVITERADGRRGRWLCRCHACGVAFELAVTEAAFRRLMVRQAEEDAFAAESLNLVEGDDA